MTDNQNLMTDALKQMPEYIKLNYSNHAWNRSQIKSRNVTESLPIDKVKRDQIAIVNTWFDGDTLVKVCFQVDIGLQNLALEIVYLVQAKLVKTVYKTKKKF